VTFARRAYFYLNSFRIVDWWLIASFYYGTRRRLFSINLNCRIIIKREKYITANQTLYCTWCFCALKWMYSITIHTRLQESIIKIQMGLEAGAKKV
jgi:hypothetical protein